MKGRHMFARRTGKALATSRTILITVFIVALWMTPFQRPNSDATIFVVLSLYLAGAVAMMIVAWRSWWHEYRLAPLAHITDIFAFVAAIYLSEIYAGEFNSPYGAITAFLLASATLRWGWAGVALTSIALTVLSAAVGISLYTFGFDMDYARLSRRLLYFGTFAIIMIWLSADQRTMRALPMPKPLGNPGERRTAVLVDMLTYARAKLHGSGAAIALGRGEEPWTEVLRDTGTALIHDRIGPEALENNFGEPNCAALIDVSRSRRISTRSSNSPIATSGPFAAPLALHCGVHQAILVNFETGYGPGQLLVWGIPDMCVDDLALVEAMGRHLTTELDHEDLAELAQEASAAAVRDALARDLHDSVAQFLAGTLFRLAALTRSIREGQDPLSELLDVKRAVRGEQAELRAMIERLRRGEETDRHTDLIEEIETLLGELSRHWHISVRINSTIRPLPVSISLAHEMRQVLREAVANAVRHGQCRTIAVTVTREVLHLKLKIADDGEGFAPNGPVPRPRSISERVEALGGSLYICNTSPGVLLEVTLPHRNAA